MDSNCGSADPPEAVGEKRPAENGGELGVPAAKKARSSGGSVGNVRRVAEIVMVLAAMGKMRGGRSPTAVETEMMAEAREKLAVVCEEFAPKDVFPRDAFGAVMEDLGLNKLREQKLGFRPPKMSIAEKVLLTKQKRLQTNLGAADKPIHAPISSGGFQPASLPYQLPASEVRTTPGSSGLPTSLLGRDSSSTLLPRVDRPHFRFDPRSNGSITPQSQVYVGG